MSIKHLVNIYQWTYKILVNHRQDSAQVKYENAFKKGLYTGVSSDEYTDYTTVIGGLGNKYDSVNNKIILDHIIVVYVPIFCTLFVLSCQWHASLT